ncbi:mechanosensitive ion channel [Aggregicoccus sp. 17bor-14]|uniref:mechanosensitive ion channel family protein n=1 Tax=Myxococcaceae TaxID=31 RepID=UPI00129CB93A|nr:MULTISPECIES: mechanosensitive ion channel domain-containing protein [Myxococcaceae]MBF5044331.1 mechanosensitive ion channel [Simulacricoccus sp. 17bor-14]MRI90078.1 mechanosensitive ion channel [Aggregicoccus sp. 17bor-14]
MRRSLPLLLWTLLIAPPAALALNPGLGEPPASVDRSTPYATVTGFSAAAHLGDYARAAHYLDLDALPAAEQSTEGPRLARRLKFVLDRKLRVGLETVSKDPAGDPTDPRFDLLGAIPLGSSTQAVQLRRVPVAGSAGAWVFTEDTVKAIDALYDAYGPPFGEHLPSVLFRTTVLELEPWQWLGLAVVLVGAFVLAHLLERIAIAIALRLARLTRFTWDDAVVAAGRGPLKLPFFALLLAIGTRFLLLPPVYQGGSDLLSRSLTILAVAWFALRFLKVSAEYVQTRVSDESAVKDPGRARGLRTQITVLRHVFEAAIYLVGAALLLMQFEVVRNVGVSLLASAGLAGLVLGLAAQKSIATLLAGIQLTVTQPVRLGDSVVIEGEFGTVEEITLSYVVIRIWDERRLVVPITQFLDKPFQNWSKGSPGMLGTVNLQVDFQADIEALRRELRRILQEEAKGLWDGRAQSLVVTEALDRTLTVRALVSTAQAGNNFDLRCLVRERLVAFVQRHPHWLPFTRTEGRQAVVPAGGSAPAPAAPGTPAPPRS